MISILTQVAQKLPKEATLILLGEYGSSAHDVAISSSDFDYIGVAVEPESSTFGLTPYEHTVLKENSAGVPTAANEEEGTIYSLKKFAKLAQAGNTSIVSALYLPKYEVLTEVGAMLIAERDIFLSRSILKRFAGHLATERRRMNGDLKEKVLRPALIEQFGFDTKAAYQAVKLGFHGRRFALEGTMAIPFVGEEKEFILAVRAGEVPVATIDALLETIMLQLDEQSEISTTLPEASDAAAISALLHRVYMATYGLASIRDTVSLL